jgi:hypothetical protein
MRDIVRRFGKKSLHSIKLLGQSFFSFILVVLFSKWFLKNFKKERSSSCIILGNGPSLGSQIEEVRALRDGNSLLCLNDFPFSLLFDELKPEYFVFVDPYYWFSLDGKVPERTDSLLRELSQKVTWPIEVFLPYEMKSIIQSNDGIQMNKQISIIYFNRVPVSGLKFMKFKMFDWNLGMPIPQNVLVAAIYLMLVASYKKILIFGADHSWHEDIVVTADNIVCIREPHFKYQKDEKSISELEGLYVPIPKFSFGKDGKQEIFKVHELFDAYSKVHQSYWALKEYANHLNAKVINLSKKSYIDAFDRAI